MTNLTTYCLCRSSIGVEGVRVIGASFDPSEHVLERSPFEVL